MSLELDSLATSATLFAHSLPFTFDYVGIRIRISSGSSPSRTSRTGEHRDVNGKGASAERDSDQDARRAILARGRRAGVFRADVTAIDLHFMISAFCFFRVSNRHTFGIFVRTASLLALPARGKT